MNLCNNKFVNLHSLSIDHFINHIFLSFFQTSMSTFIYLQFGSLFYYQKSYSFFLLACYSSFLLLFHKFHIGLLDIRDSPLCLYNFVKQLPLIHFFYKNVLTLFFLIIAWKCRLYILFNMLKCTYFSIYWHFPLYVLYLIIELGMAIMN